MKTEQSNCQLIPFQFIPLKDGRRLAARLWLPKTANENPVPAILEYHPYRFQDGSSVIDSYNHPWFAANGYASVRVDIHGTGDSNGVMVDEYTVDELADGLEVLRWIARQPWCSGNIAMMGISWGGFNSLQIAALRPPELKAIACVAFSDDRYADDVHYMGGCLLTQNFGWSMAMTAFNSRPPDPLVSGPNWRSIWRQRLSDHQPFIAIWLKHSHRDDYWKRGSVCENYEDIHIPIYALSGWVDPYSNSVSRILAGASVPCRGIVGPWAHQYPHIASPGPRIGFLQDLLRWWNRWLKYPDDHHGSDKEYVLWVQEGAPPLLDDNTAHGYWISLDRDPAGFTEQREFSLAKGRLLEKEDTFFGKDPIIICTPNTVGTMSGIWCPTGHAEDMPGDQQTDDAQSVVFDSSKLTEDITICGAPEIKFEFTCDQPRAFLCARLCEVDSNGASTRISYGLLNLSHSQGHERSAPLKPGRRYEARLRLNDAAHTFAPGHKIRLSLSTTYWPLVWPSAKSATVKIYPDRSVLIIPMLKNPRQYEKPNAFDPPERSLPEPHEISEPSSVTRTTGMENEKGRHRIRVENDTGMVQLRRTGILRREIMRETYLIDSSDPLSAEMQSHWTTIRRREDWDVRTEVFGRMNSTESAFNIEIEIKAYEDESLTFETFHEFQIPRKNI
jgi:putative CocE/NonD family hydrolase